ncbi:tRNA threonylcarbamoyladenosine biosynthesis protein TsaE [Defluviimonas aquaemixtae]|uniref:tRNA threonylcarbamoyladenosine biosynthesis protein TsaE n=1 Tax=Albidovulum aquaemixtae TaxID=1542388 RepID=A0A2R8BJD4_9RHOB|nr:tRNA (adenosine(37)-N6)-threonylcarbamoyltransferase complex ATPase subunit type 1 TsaE [Defluviimonas aquaemixtae]SPH23516.1 tRNA threonylcarbamoyladenosine biosynthesis protein TsaE [Defluviimonas aquaemixtae]
MQATARDSALSLTLPNAAATAALAERLSPELRSGDVILVQGPIGAGKSHFCRSLITARLAALGRAEDIPSPTFTLVQTYDLDGIEIWHCDLYRLGLSDDLAELGLDEAFETAICLVEWPDRLGDRAPSDALTLSLVPDSAGEAREAQLSSTAPRWHPVIAGLSNMAGELDD